MLKTTGLVGNVAASASPAEPAPLPQMVKQEPVHGHGEAMEDDIESPIANDPMLSASLTNAQDFNIDEAMNGYWH